MASRFSKLSDWSAPEAPQLPPLESLRQWVTNKRRRDPSIPSPNQPSDVDRSKGMADLPLSAAGERSIQDDADELSRLGSFETIMFSRLKRTDATAQIIARATGGVLLDITPHSLPWFLGGLEGQPVKDTLEDLRYYVLHPSEPIAGTGAISGYPGESYADFKSRWLGWLRDGPMRGSLADVNRVLIASHSHNQKVLKDWIDAGARADLTTADSAIVDQSEPPGSLDRLWRQAGRWRLDHPFDSAAHQSLPPGIYVIRHGATPWNKQEPDDSAS